MDLVLFGIQGSGKGTQAKRIAAAFGYDIFEAGGELRAIAASGSSLGEIVKSYIDLGHLVPHEIIMQVVKEAMAKRSMDQKIIFDGIPRDAEQKRDFDAVMQEQGRDFTCLQILLDEEEAVCRILARAQKQGRVDDADESIIRKRMATFHEKTEPVIASYNDAGKLIQVDGGGTVDEIYARVTRALELA
ncbi:adenylate kinase [Candidatus Peregrinibacteria bacterium CG10_big_fil_rev_8_21_14_0_10_49_10]|nr:MAG: adenylate kinase [Candidatus Peregrinibacteria bacterium CG10_big_fil_rev_8_21_14_0_10_49_10]